MEKLNEYKKCNIIKNFNEFHKKTTGKYEIKNICKSCSKIINSEYNKNNYLKNHELLKKKRQLNYLKNVVYNKYHCKICDFFGGTNYNLKRHNSSQKHLKNVEKNEISKMILNNIINNI